MSEHENKKEDEKLDKKEAKEADKKAPKKLSQGRVVMVLMPGARKAYPGLVVDVLGEKERAVVSVHTPEGLQVVEADHAPELPKVADAGSSVWAWPKH